MQTTTNTHHRYNRELAERITAAILADDSGDAPGSIYGTSASSWAPVAAVACVIYANESGESPLDEDGAVDLDWCHGFIAATVNCELYVGEWIIELGPLYGFDPDDFIDRADFS